ncbi:acyltransferase family protein [Sphingomonas sp. R86521]|uniref:acyltransferase family protein n=1 Tax=Sphingomonas sp. R86521 TaxID=3093860 RepID=UPI0036D3A4E2
MQAHAVGSKDNFDVLNGLRGVAAIAVVTMHLSFYLAAIHPANVAPAVDFFFVLSGFVIAFAYERRLVAGFGFGRFVLARLIRLYPLYLIGLTIGAAAMWTYQRPLDPAGFYAHLALNMLMLPSPTGFDPTNHDLFPLNFTYWSLFFELVANLGYAAVAPRLGNRLLAAIILLGLAGLIASGLVAGSLDNGTLRSTFFGGLARVTFSFFAGVGLYRLWCVRPTRISLHPAILFVLLILPLMLKPAPPIGWVYELAVITLYMPLMVWLGAGSRPIGRWRSIAVALGALSYPVYVIHAPVWTAIRAFHGWRGNVFLHDRAPWSGLMLTVLLCAVAWALDRYVDYPLRRRLSKTLLHRTTHAADPSLGDS